MAVSVFMFDKARDFKLFGKYVERISVYDVGSNPAYNWRIKATFSEQPNVNTIFIDTLLIPYQSNDICVFSSCKVRSITEDENIYSVIITAEGMNVTYMYDIVFKDGKRTVIIDDAMLVSDRYGDLRNFTYEEFEIRLITCRL